MNQHLLKESDLLEWLGIEKRAALEKRLREKGIKIIYGRNGCVCTTLDAVNSAIGVHVDNNNYRDIEF